MITVKFYLTVFSDYFSFAIVRTFGTFSNDGDDAGDVGDINDEKDPDDKELEDEFEHYLDETKKSDELRTSTVSELIENIKASPIIGHGLGKGLMVRGNGEELNEYSYLDIMSKTGIIGLVLFILPAAYMVFSLLFKKSKKFNMAKIWMSVLLGFMVFSYFNPYISYQ
jgi:hypothetical protein